MGYLSEMIGYLFYRPKEQSIFNATKAFFMEDYYLLRRAIESEVIHEEFPNPDTNATSLDENSAPKNLQVHIEVLHRSDKVPRYSHPHVGHIVTNGVDTLYLKDS